MRHNVIVVTDEMHGDLVFPEHKFTPFASLGSKYADISITCLSPAKTFNIASCCSSFTVIPNEEKRLAFQTENSRLTVNKNNAFANVAMEAAYTHCDEWLRLLIIYLKKNVDLVKSRVNDMTGINFIQPDGMFLVWLDFRELNLDTDQLTQFLRGNAKWAITKGSIFGNEGIGFARLNIGCTQSKLSMALDNLEEAINGLKKLLIMSCFQ